MFHNRKISELSKKCGDLENEIEHIKTELIRLRERDPELENEFSNIRQLIDNRIVHHSNEVETRLLQFHKEITDRYFSALEKILRVHSESSLITALAHQVNQKDLTNLRSALLKPFLEEKWRQDEIDKGLRTDENIRVSGQQLVQLYKQLSEEILEKERKGEDFSEIKGKLAILNLVIGDVK